MDPDTNAPDTSSEVEVKDEVASSSTENVTNVHDDNSKEDKEKESEDAVVQEKEPIEEEKNGEIKEPTSESNQQENTQDKEDNNTNNNNKENDQATTPADVEKEDKPDDDKEEKKEEKVKEEEKVQEDNKEEKGKEKVENDNNKNNKEEEKKEYSDHLVVLQHGLHGSDKDFDFVKLQMETKYKGIVVHNAKSNATFLKTQDGIVNAGNRLAKEILEVIDKKPNLKKISMIGHSLGGIISRYAVGKLYEAKVFDKLTPTIFMTIASPNVGSRRPMRGTFNKLVSHFTSKLLQRTGMELMLEDETPEGVPLLVLLARKGTSYMEGLALFRTRVLYSNIKSDVSVPYCTAAIVHKNPYKSGDRKITLSKDYPHIIEYEEKEETTLEVGKEDIKDLSDELIGGPEDKEKAYRDSGIWQYSPSEIDNNSNNSNSNNNSNNTTDSSSDNNSNNKTDVNESTEKKESESKKEIKEALSDATGQDAKNADISKETVLEKLFERDSKGEHLTEILRSLQTLTWKRYDVCFDTWFLAYSRSSETYLGQHCRF